MHIKPMNYFTRARRRPPISTIAVNPRLVGTDEQLLSGKQTFVVTYLVLPGTNANHVQTLAELFTETHASLDYHVASNPLFFKLEEAIQYLHFMGDNQIILKAIIPQMAVEGRFETLHVRTELLKVKHIYGGYTSIEANHFVLNPCFDASILTCVTEPNTCDENE